MVQKTAKKGAGVEGGKLERLQILVGIAPPQLFRLLWRHRFRVARGRRRDIGQVFFVSLCVALCNLGDRAHARSRRQTQALPPPIFIVGHWRSGTTFLHKLLSLDPELHAPTFFECCVPRGFESGERWLKERIQRNLPPQRPFDAAPFGVDEPFEDEFVLAREALVSPMLEAVFPGSPNYRQDLQPADLPASKREAWERALLDFTRRLTHARRRRLVLKSPAHSFRIPHLRRLYPGAKFIVLRREPAAVLASTFRTEALLMEHSALQALQSQPDKEWLRRRQRLLDEALMESLKDLPLQDVAEVRYEDLCRDPMKALAGIYEGLELPQSQPQHRAVGAYLQSSQYLGARHLAGYSGDAAALRTAG